MKTLLSLPVILLSLQTSLAQTTWSSEVQTSFIDITGLFGLNEFAQVTTATYTHNHLFMNGYHSFSWKEPGKTIQTFFGVGYTFKLDSLKRGTLAIKNDFAFNRVADNGSFVRLMLIYQLKLNDRNRISAFAWTFRDTRLDYPGQHLNGGITYLAHTYTCPFKTWKFQNELRVLYATIHEVRKVGGVINQVKFSLKGKPYYLGGTAGYSFYRSDGQREFIWNVVVGCQF